MQMKKPSTNPSLSQFGDTFRNGSEVLSKSTATVKKLIANNLKHHLLENDSKNNHTIKNHQSFSFYEGASQDFIPIKNIQDEMIITKDGKKISDGIEDCCHRGSTIIPVMGGYRQEKKYAVLCVCNNKQMFEITQQVKRLDPESFMIIWESNEVHGDGFKALTIGEK